MTPKCACGRYSIGDCTTCGLPVCGDCCRTGALTCRACQAARLEAARADAQAQRDRSEADARRSQAEAAQAHRAKQEAWRAQHKPDDDLRARIAALHEQPHGRVPEPNSAGDLGCGLLLGILIGIFVVGGIGGILFGVVGVAGTPGSAAANTGIQIAVVLGAIAGPIWMIRSEASGRRAIVRNNAELAELEARFGCEDHNDCTGELPACSESHPWRTSRPAP